MNFSDSIIENLWVNLIKISEIEFLSIILD